jgi:hypothetical protein
VAKLSCTDVALGAEALLTTGAPEVNRAGCALIMLKVKATSLALNGLPSFHLTPERTGIVRVFPPLENVGWPDASTGIPGSVGRR